MRRLIWTFVVRQSHNDYFLTFRSYYLDHCRKTPFLLESTAIQNQAFVSIQVFAVYMYILRDPSICKVNDKDLSKTVHLQVGLDCQCLILEKKSIVFPTTNLTLKTLSKIVRIANGMLFIIITAQKKNNTRHFM